MSDERESTSSILDEEDESHNVSNQIDLLTLMKNMIADEEASHDNIDIFDENNHSIHPTFWTKQTQLATCKKCGRTGESIIKKKCGIGNICCTCCFCLVCLWSCVPFMCCLVCDYHHYCSSCEERMGIKTFM